MRLFKGDPNLKKNDERKQPEVDRDHLAATERKRAEEALQRSEALYRLVVENINDIVWTFDLSSMTYTFVSPSLQSILGYDVETMVKNPDVIFTSETKQRVLKAFGEFIESNAEEDILVMDAEHRQKDGHLIWMEISASPLKDDIGNIVGFLGTTRDITERRRAEEEKAKLEGQLHQAQKMESVAHDFNNMLGIIIGHVELAMDQMDPALPLHANLEQILKAANHSADLTRQLLAFARKQTIAPKVLDLNETVEGMLKMLRRLIGEDIDLSWQPKANLWPIKVDPSQIDQILANLCINSRDAISGVGKMIVETGNRTFEADYCGAHAGFTPGEYVMLAVSDDGYGMDKKTLSLIFEPFFTTKEMGKGTGLGLATVYGIVKQNSGFINVYSEPDLGTKFTIYLPRHKGNAAKMQQDALAEPVARGDETILLVEDDPAILELVMMMLTKLGYTVLTAGTPSGITHLAAEHVGKIHLLMTDVVMPGMNGGDLARNLLPCYPHLKHLFMSGYTADVIAHNGILDDGVNFIQKPFSMKELAVKVRDALLS
jgi:PAS domain S-box-containing protein